MNSKVVVFGVVVAFAIFFAWQFAGKQEPVIEKTKQCTYSVFVTDSETNHVVSGAKVTYEYNQSLFVGYLDSEGYYKIKIPCDANAPSSAKLRVGKAGYKIYGRSIPLNLERTEDVKLEADAITASKQRADNGDIKAANELAHNYKTGNNDVSQNYEKAFYYYELGAKQGNSDAQVQLGIMFEKGQFVEVDYQQAFKWYEKASNQGHPTGTLHLGRMYHDGKGVEKNITKAIQLWGLASRDEFIKSQALDLIKKARGEMQKPTIEEEPTKTVYKPKESDENSNTEFSCANVTEIPQAECEELVNFYHSTGGDNWRKNEGWLQTHSPCSWLGIKCKNGSVIKLSLWRKRLSGTIPDFSALTQLQKLDLSHNRLIGTIPDFSALTQLQKLDLSYNKLIGTIPDFFALTQLHWLNLRKNQLSGTIPDFSTLTQLQILDLYTNNLCRNPNINYGIWEYKLTRYPICE